ncbi:MAG TPA: peroxidase-related enzyme [Streptosporangiaceae bacterium]
MPHISLGNDQPGIRSLFQYRPETAYPMSLLVEVLLRGPNTLSPGDRELIATYVSSRNDCSYCTSAHAAFAAAQLPEGMALVDQVRADLDTAPVTPKLAALLRIAGAVQRSGKEVSAEDIELARKEGATDLEIHDTVLIAATFCMFNRYVDGLATTVRPDAAGYARAAHGIVHDGYLAVLGQYADVPQGA